MSSDRARPAIVELTLLRVREFLREPEAVFWALVFPILLTTGLGIAFRNQAPDRLHIAAESPSLAKALEQERTLIVDTLTQDEARQALDTGKVSLVVEPTSTGVTFRYDDANPDGRLARLRADAALQVAEGRSDPVHTADDLQRATGSRYIDFLVPGLVGMGIMGNAIWGLAFAIVDARRRNLMKRIIATPMRRRDYLLSFLLWRLLLLVFEVSIPVGFGVLAFGVPLRGSLAVLVLVSVMGSLAFSAIGLLLASRARTIEAVSGLTNLVMMPMWIASGVFFSADRFPAALQPVIRALPLTALNDALRSNMLQGAGLLQLLPKLGVLGIYLVATFTLALRVFRWR
jgi:ABC-type multidrug transport system permease subunit